MQHRAILKRGKGDRMSRNPAMGSRRSTIALSMVSLLLILLGSGCGTSTSTLPPPPPAFPQTKLDVSCFPKFAVSLPVFGPAGSIPRVDAAAHPNLTVTMKEIDQAVLPQGSFTQCGTKVTLGQTRVWAYQTTDSNTGAVLGPASWPAVTIVAQRGTPTQAQIVNQLPSYNPSNPTGPGLVTRRAASRSDHTLGRSLAERLWNVDAGSAEFPRGQCVRRRQAEGPFCLQITKDGIQAGLVFQTIFKAFLNGVFNADGSCTAISEGADYRF